MPPIWKDKEYDDIPIVQDARPAEHYVEAYLQGTSDIPTFRVVWITSMGTMSRSKVVSPNRFGDPKLWKTPDEHPEFWEPCRHDQGYITLSPGEDDCCRMCPNTDADELVPCAWCNSWAHSVYHAVGPGRACASHFKVMNPLDEIVVARDDDPIVPTAQRESRFSQTAAIQGCRIIKSRPLPTFIMQVRHIGSINTLGEEWELSIRRATTSKRRRLEICQLSSRH